MPLQITIPEREYIVEDAFGNISFETSKEIKLTLEHSLISLQRWESKWHKAFLDPQYHMTEEETDDYIRCMVIKPSDINISVIKSMPINTKQEILAYMQNPMTATVINSKGNRNGKSYGRKNQKVTAEVLYWQMIALDIPFECRTWHLNQLLTLIRVCDIKNGGGGKMSKKEGAAWQTAMNNARKAKHHTKG